MLLLGFPQAPLARPVRFDAPAMPLGRLLPELGRSAGVELVASPSVAKDVALVRVKDKPLGEVLAHLAEEDGAEVEATKSGYRIVRTPSSERKEHRMALAGRIAQLKPGLNGIQRSLSKPADAQAYRSLFPALKAERESNPSGVSWVRSGAATSMDRTPAARAAMRVALSIPLETLADLREGDRIVYSNAPTRLQRKLPGLQDVVSAFGKEYDAWNSVASTQGPVKQSDYADDP